MKNKFKSLVLKMKNNFKYLGKELRTIPKDVYNDYMNFFTKTFIFLKEILIFICIKILHFFFFILIQIFFAINIILKLLLIKKIVKIIFFKYSKIKHKKNILINFINILISWYTSLLSLKFISFIINKFQDFEAQKRGFWINFFYFLFFFFIFLSYCAYIGFTENFNIFVFFLQAGKPIFLWIHKNICIIPENILIIIQTELMNGEGIGTINNFKVNQVFAKVFNASENRRQNYIAAQYFFEFIQSFNWINIHSYPESFSFKKNGDIWNYNTYTFFLNFIGNFWWSGIKMFFIFPGSIDILGDIFTSKVTLYLVFITRNTYCFLRILLTKSNLRIDNATLLKIMVNIMSRKVFPTLIMLINMDPVQREKTLLEMAKVLKAIDWINMTSRKLIDKNGNPTPLCDDIVSFYIFIFYFNFVSKYFGG